MKVPASLIKLHDINSETKFWTGSIFRQYDVDRIDAKSADQNYYDLMLVDFGIIKKNTFGLVNVTLNSDNKGRIISVFSNVNSKYFLQAIHLQNYFTPDSNIYFVQDWEQLLSQ